MAIYEFLAICATCKAIRTFDSDLWLKRETNPVLYDRLITRYGKNITHTICPEDAGKTLKGAGLE